MKILWVFTVQCDRKIEARRPNIVIVNKEREFVIIDVAIPVDKELEKLEKYQLLKDEIVNVWRMQKFIVAPVVIGALGTVSVNFEEYMKRVGVKVRLDYPKNSIVGDSKDTKNSTVNVRKKRKPGSRGYL